MKTDRQIESAILKAILKAVPVAECLRLQVMIGPSNSPLDRIVMIWMGEPEGTGKILKRCNTKSLQATTFATFFVGIIESQIQQLAQAYSMGKADAY